MTRDELEHAIRAACDVAGDNERKLAAFRDKDRDFVRVLLVEGMLTAKRLIARLRHLPIDGTRIDRLIQWVNRTAQELKL